MSSTLKILRQSDVVAINLLYSCCLTYSFVIRAPFDFGGWIFVIYFVFLEDLRLIWIDFQDIHFVMDSDGIGGFPIAGLCVGLEIDMKLLF